MMGWFSVFLPWLFIGMKYFLSMVIFMPFMKKRNRFKIKLMGFFIGMTICVALLSVIRYNIQFGVFFDVVHYFVITVLLFFCLVCCCKSTIIGYLYHLVSCVMLSTALESLRNSILYIRYFEISFYIIPDTWLDVLITLVLMAAVYGTVYFFFVKNHAECNDITPDRSIFVLYVMCFIIMPALSIIANIISTEKTSIAIILQIIAALYAMSMLFSQYVIYIGKLHEFQKKNAQIENDAIQRISRETFEMYNALKENMDTINIKCHDLKHRIANGSFEGGDKWSEELVDSMDIYDRTIKTGNEQLDTVLMYHQMKCHAQKIMFSVVADGRRLSFMELADIYSLFGNAITNATEYLVGIPEEKRILRLFIKIHNSFMIIHFENWFDGELDTENGIPTTHKDDRTNHGFGIKSMKMIAEKYGGTLDISVKNNLFQLNFCFPLSE